jgi:hypothetical protein
MKKHEQQQNHHQQNNQEKRSIIQVHGTLDLDDPMLSKSWVRQSWVRRHGLETTARRSSVVGRWMREDAG